MSPSKSPVHSRLSPRSRDRTGQLSSGSLALNRRDQISPPRKSSRPKAKDTFFDSPGTTSAAAQDQGVIVPEVARKLECFRLVSLVSEGV